MKEYSLYAERIRAHTQHLPVDDAVHLAVNECIRDGILSDFLLTQKTEVIAMSIFEYNEEVELKKIREDEYSPGVEAGMKEGLKEGLKTGRIEGGLEALVLTCREFGLSKKKIIEKAARTYALSFSEAKEYVDQFRERVV